MDMQRNNEETASINVSLSSQINLSMDISNKTMMQTNNTLEIGNQNEVYYLQPHMILYVEADGNYCDIHLTDGDVLETVSFQRSEIARKIDTQLSKQVACSFSLVGKNYLVNIRHIMHINASKQQLTFDINLPGTCKKTTIKATPNALRNLRQALEEPAMPVITKPVSSKVNGGFTSYLTQTAETEKNYDIEDDEVMMLGR